MTPPTIDTSEVDSGLRWSAQSVPTRVYSVVVMVAGLATAIAWWPDRLPQPGLFALVVGIACLTAAWKVNLPIALTSGSTLSMSYAGNLMALLLLGPTLALVVAVIAVWTQCTYRVKRRYPAYRTLFSMAAEALTMAATGWAYEKFGGGPAAVASYDLAKPLVGAISTYFLVNTGLVAGVIALSVRQPFWRIWRDDFLWSGAGFMVAGSAGALAAAVIAGGHGWKAALLLAPVQLTYRTYQLFVARLGEQRQHVLNVEALNAQAVAALANVREAEAALSRETEQLNSALAEMRRLETQRQQLLQQAQAARATAERASRLKDQFLAIVSHELRTPLNAVLGWSDMLRHGRIRESQQAAAIESINRSARRQAELIDDLLDVARIVSGKLRLNRTVIDPRTVVEDAVHMVQSGAQARGVTLEAAIEPGIAHMYADGSRLQQITSNLLSNAVKFTPAGGTVSLQLYADGDRLRLDVSDTGQGIAPEFLPEVFEPFRQADGSSTRRQGGLGLGLAIVRHLVQAHGGSIHAHSDGPGLGARFTVELPMASPPEHVRGRTASRSSAAFGEMPALDGVSVLVVDDDPECRQVVAAQLEGCRASVLTAASAEQAFALLQRDHVDVLLSDIAMPGEDGYSLIRRVRESGLQGARIPAAALTAFAGEGDRERALRAGFQLHLAKPVDAGALIEAVAQLAPDAGSPHQP